MSTGPWLIYDGSVTPTVVGLSGLRRIGHTPLRVEIDLPSPIRLTVEPDANVRVRVPDSAIPSFVVANFIEAEYKARVALTVLSYVIARISATRNYAIATTGTVKPQVRGTSAFDTGLTADSAVCHQADASLTVETVGFRAIGYYPSELVYGVELSAETIVRPLIVASFEETVETTAYIQMEGGGHFRNADFTYAVATQSPVKIKHSSDFGLEVSATATSKPRFTLTAPFTMASGLAAATIPRVPANAVFPIDVATDMDVDTFGGHHELSAPFAMAVTPAAVAKTKIPAGFSFVPNLTTGHRVRLPATFPMGVQFDATAALSWQPYTFDEPFDTNGDLEGSAYWSRWATHTASPIKLTVSSNALTTSTTSTDGSYVPMARHVTALNSDKAIIRAKLATAGTAYGSFIGLCGTSTAVWPLPSGERSVLLNSSTASGAGGILFWNGSNLVSKGTVVTTGWTSGLYVSLEASFNGTNWVYTARRGSTIAGMTQISQWIDTSNETLHGSSNRYAFIGIEFNRALYTNRYGAKQDDIYIATTGV